MDLETCSWCTQEVEDSTLRTIAGGDGARLCKDCIANETEIHGMIVLDPR